MAIIDGDERMPSTIAEDSGFVGEVITTDEVKQAVAEVVNSNPAIIEKIIAGNDRPLMSLVGKVMRSINRRGDPVVVKVLIEEAILGKKGAGWTPPKAESAEEDNQ